MIGEKYLSEAVHAEEIKAGQLNLVKAPVGAGKTTWALNTLAEEVTDKHRMVYLIDTVNGKQQLLRNENTTFYDRDWQEIVNSGIVYFGEKKVVVMTYAKFGVLAEKYPKFGFDFELILCDEIHNLIRFNTFTQNNPNDKRWHAIAKKRIEEIILKSAKTKVIGLSATPDRAEKAFSAPVHRITVDKEVREFETKAEYNYSNLEYLIESMPKGKVGLVYVARITQMKRLVEMIKAKGLHCVAVWSINNKDNPMTEEQLAARDYIINQEQLPPDYDVVIINASSETSINIRGKIDYIVIHTTEEEVRTQVRGRYRDDLEELYLYDKESLEVPEEFLNVPLFKEDKDALCEILRRTDEFKRLVKWTKTKEKLLEEGYEITEKRYNNRRYAIISL
ncbi:DEAD/DEAH box helicase family protein [Ihubacter sp. rT4E-8]|uniref:DEAD/DEAH box helicase family protein n=1 Tax=Ihubacter sp. rT4E-8 TaxID=3242369 RepID=UPI003CF62DE5